MYLLNKLKYIGGGQHQKECIKMKKSKARILLENLSRNQILQHKKEKNFYVEHDEGYFTINRDEKIIAVDGIEFAETVVKHHDTRNWQVIESAFAERHPLVSIID